MTAQPYPCGMATISPATASLRDARIAGVTDRLPMPLPRAGRGHNLGPTYGGWPNDCACACVIRRSLGRFWVPWVDDVGSGVGMAVRERAQVLVTVKAQPALSTRHGEVICVAGVRLDRKVTEWIRLFPVGFRDLEQVVKFKKYQLLEVSIARPKSDLRPESFTPDMATAVLGDVVDTGPGKSWGKRWEILRPLADTATMCELNRDQRDTHRAERTVPSLAMLRPAEVLGVDVIDTPKFTTAQRNLASAAAAADLFGEAREPLEPPPFTVRYRWRCLEPGCTGHDQSCVDWEVGGAARKWLRYQGPETVRRQLQVKWQDQLCGPGRDPYFFVGNQHQYPQSYLILGVFWPPHDAGRLAQQLTLL